MTIDLLQDTDRAETLRQLRIRQCLTRTTGFPAEDRIRDAFEAMLNFGTGQKVYEHSSCPLLVRSFVSAVVSEMEVKEAISGLVKLLYDEQQGTLTPEAKPFHLDCDVKALKIPDADRKQMGKDYPSDGVRYRVEQMMLDGFRKQNGEKIRRAVSRLLMNVRRENDEQEAKRLKPLTGSGKLSQCYLIPDVLVARQPAVIGGPHKGNKTIIAVELAVALATGRAFMGKYPVPKPVRVLMYSGESGDVTLDGYLSRAKGVCPNLRLYPGLPKPSTLVDEIIEFEPDVVILDPLYLLLDGEQASNLYVMGQQLRNLCELIMNAGSTPVMVHHCTEKPKVLGAPSLNDLAFAGIKQYARQWMIVRRRQAYKKGKPDYLNLAIGGTAGHSELFSVDHTSNPWTWTVKPYQAPKKKKGEKTDDEEEQEDVGNGYTTPGAELLDAIINLGLEKGDRIPVGKIWGQWGVTKRETAAKEGVEHEFMRIDDSKPSKKAYYYLGI